MDNEFFNRKINNYWFYFIITILLSYGYFLTHSSMGIDDEIMSNYVHPYYIMTTDRICSYIFKILQIWDYIPFWKEMIAILVFSIGIIMHSKNFMLFLNFDNFKFDKKLATIFSCIVVSFPFFSFLFIFMEQCFQTGFNMIFSAVSCHFIYKYFYQEKRKKYLFISFLALFFMISFYELGILYFILPLFFIEFVGFIFYDKKDKKLSYNILFSSITILSLSIILRTLIAYIIRENFNFEYDKIKAWFNYDFSSINNFFSSYISATVDFVNKFIQTCFNNTGSFVTFISYILFIGILLFYFFKKRNKHILIYGLLLMISPFSFFLLTGNSSLYCRLYSSLGFFNAFTFVLLYFILSKHKILSRFILLFISLIIFYQSKEINLIFYTKHLKFENDKMFAYSIKHEVDKLGGKPVLFIGTRENPKLKYEYYIESPEINTSIFNWDRYDDINSELFTDRAYSFMKEQGIGVNSYIDEIKITNEEDYKNFLEEIKQASKGMSIYPKQGSIKDNGNYVIIKIGDSKADIE